MVRLTFSKMNNIRHTHLQNITRVFVRGYEYGCKDCDHIDYFLYAHDDFYFSPDWDDILYKEVEKIGHNRFYLSGTMMNEGQIKFNCGNTPKDFNENKFLDNYKNHNYYDFQGLNLGSIIGTS